MDHGISLRNRLQKGNGCSFTATVTADYGTYLHTFALQCAADATGEIRFQVLAPDTISGITGMISGQQGKLTFDEEVLLFSPLADGLLAPVTAPWVLVQTLKGGYIVSGCQLESGMELSIDDSYAENALRLDVQLNDQDLPVSAEIFWEGRRILSMLIEDFQIL